MARASGAETINYEEEDVSDMLMQLTGGRGPDSCMDAVGLEAHAPGPVHYYDRMKQAVMLESDRPYALRQAILACRNGGTVSVPGVYGGFDDKIPIGVMNKGLTIKTGQTHVPRYFGPLLGRIQEGEIDPSFIITHRLPLNEAPHGFAIFNEKEDNCPTLGRARCGVAGVPSRAKESSPPGNSISWMKSMTLAPCRNLYVSRFRPASGPWRYGECSGCSCGR